MAALARSEHDEQRLLCEWFHHQYPSLRGLLYASGNGLHIAGDAKARAIKWRKFQKTGGRKGVADLFLMVAVAPYHGMYIEMKSATGTASKEQREFLEDASRQGYCVAVCKGFDAGRKVVSGYLINYQGGNKSR